ncbi:DUF2252 domain-containing protein [Antiquaquibacter oligotrophicus]|uniref:DUF2252 domain-containing protein n=1 Tax=Antiquaquibacter oligotrophicus TaxID=2880260 RepID=UPI002AC9C841|nr:DUF2252 domain-containing protein [Antiquaquibacter oligotrophicus]
MRARVPRSSLSTHRPAERDPRAIIDAQNTTRVQELVPLRLARMTASPFAFYRGTAAIMANDLADAPSTGIHIVSCGDAHISNFGFFASPQRTLVFDLNDFDEAGVGPWEWDLKRLVTSVIIGARDIGIDEAVARRTALATAAAYRSTLRELVSTPVLDRYFRVADLERISARVRGSARSVVEKAARQARKRTSEHAVARMTSVDAAGHRRFVNDPPVLARLSDEERRELSYLVEQYARTLRVDVAMAFSQYRLVDVAVRVVGVGSVGTRCFVALFSGPSEEPLVLQIKEALPSVVEAWGGIGAGGAQHEGQRVVSHQRVLQAVSDPFLGWITGRENRHYYVRQFRDMKGSIDLDALTPGQFGTYASGCAIVLARAHSQSPHAPSIAGYLGSSDRFDRSVVEWSLAYADQSLADFRAVAASL